jgi:hypothetical protein
MPNHSTQRWLTHVLPMLSAIAWHRPPDRKTPDIVYINLPVAIISKLRAASLGQSWLNPDEKAIIG